MEAKLTLYDILAIVIPGGLLLIVIFSIAWAMGVRWPEELAQSLTGTTVFLILTYFVGQFLQAVGNWYESKFLKVRWDGFPSTRFLRNSDDHFSQKYKDILFTKIDNMFGISLVANDSESEITDKHRIEAFRLCYSYIVERKLATQALSMNTTYGLFRGLVVTCGLCTLLFLCLAVILYLEYKITNSATNVSLSLSATFLVLAKVFDVRLKQRGELFADKVYQSFLASTKLARGENK